MKCQRIVFAFVLLLSIGGCIPDHWPQKWRQMAQDKTESPQDAPMPQWCYKTLGSVDCYDKPHPEWRNRLVSEPPPRVLPQPEAKETVSSDKRAAPTPLHGE